jgi:polar amino acid transport system substrate-binding protein
MRKTRLWALVAVLVLAALSVLAAGCGDDDDEGDGGGGGAADLGLIQEGQLFVGTDTPYEPFAIGQPPDISGYDIEVLNAIAENLGLEVEYRDTGFQTIFRDVAAGQFDTAAAASSINPKREEVVDFTDPYYVSNTVLLVPEGSDIASVDDLSGVIVGTQDGTIQEDYGNEETDADEVRGYPEIPNAISAMVTGQVDAVIVDQAVGIYAADRVGGIEIVEEIDTGRVDFFGFALAPEKDALREAMNEALAELKDDGTLAALYDKYFHDEPPRSVLEGTNELLTDD